MPAFNFGTAKRKVDLLQNRVQKTIELSVEKVAAHVNDPKKYPLPADPKSVERTLFELYNALPAVRRKKLLKDANDSLKKTTAKRKAIYGDLLTADFLSAEPITEQVKKLPVPADHKLTRAEKTGLELKLKSPDGRMAIAKNVKTKAVSEPRGLARTLTLFVDSIKCNKVSEVLKDEIHLKTFAIDAIGNKVAANPFFIGQFKKNQTIALGNKAKLFDFDLRAAVTFPQTFFANFILIERDLVSNQALLNKIIDFTIAVMEASVAVMYACAALMLFIPVFYVILPVTIIITGCLALIGGLLAFLLDEISVPAFDTFIFDLPFPQGTFVNRTVKPIFTKYLSDKTDGEYTLNLRWERTV